MDANKNLIIDFVALALYLVVANPLLTGIAVHEWFGIGIAVAFIVHCAMHFDWIVETIRSFGRLPWARRSNLVLDAFILVCFMAVTVSGLCISGDFLRTFGLYSDGYYFWNPLHAIAAKGLLALLLVHVAVHWKWLYNFIRRSKSDSKLGGHDSDGVAAGRGMDERENES